MFSLNRAFSEHPLSTKCVDVDQTGTAIAKLLFLFMFRIPSAQLD